MNHALPLWMTVLLALCLPRLAWAQDVCMPNEAEPCRLSDGCGGFRTCNRWGTGYGSCLAHPDSPNGAPCTGCEGRPGTVTCTTSRQRLGCRVAEVEACNNCDDDGDGLTDNAEGSSQANTLARACNPNACSAGGLSVCTSGLWGPCTGCGGSAPCTGCEGRSGTALCDASCGRGACNVGPERCNNCDDDADGYRDNAPGVPQDNSLILACGLNACGQAGTQACSQGVLSACVHAEVCNNCDDDNDGVVDEGLSCQPCDL